MEIINGHNVDNLDNAVGGMLTTLATGMRCIAEAADVMAALVQRHGQAVVMDELQTKAPQITSLFWRRLQAIGEHAMDPRLLYGSTPAHNKLRKLSMRQQSSALDTGVTVYTTGCTDEDNALLMQVDNITPYQARMVFADDHIRSIEEQRAWAESEAARKEAGAKSCVPYKVQGKKVIFSAGCSLSHADLLRLAQETAK